MIKKEIIRNGAVLALLVLIFSFPFCYTHSPKTWDPVGFFVDKIEAISVIAANRSRVSFDFYPLIPTSEAQILWSQHSYEGDTQIVTGQM